MPLVIHPDGGKLLLTDGGELATTEDCCCNEDTCSYNCIDSSNESSEATVVLSGFTGDLAYLNGGYSLPWVGTAAWQYDELGPPAFNVEVIAGVGSGFEICANQINVVAARNGDICVIAMGDNVTDIWTSGCVSSGTLPFRGVLSGGAGCTTDATGSEADYVLPTV